MSSDVKKKLNRLKVRKIYESLILGIDKTLIIDSIPEFDFSRHPKCEHKDFSLESIDNAITYLFDLFAHVFSHDKNKKNISFCSSEITENFWIRFEVLSQELIKNALNRLSSLEFVIADSEGKAKLLFLEDEYNYSVYQLKIDGDKSMGADS